MMYTEPPAPGITALRKHISSHQRSPLVVRYAAALIDAGEYEDALKLCRVALEQFSYYPTLHLILAKAQVALQQFVPARRRAQQLLAEHPACLAASRLIERIDRLERQSIMEGGEDNKGIPDLHLSSPEPAEKQKKMNWSWREHLIPGGDSIVSKRMKDFELAGERTAEEAYTPEEIRPPAPVSERAENGGHPFAKGIDLSYPDFDSGEENDLEILAGQLDAASMPRITDADTAQEPGPEFEPVNLESRPVTETLAEIYVKQGKLSEAIDAYRKLRETNRDKRYEYTVRISEIKRLIDERSSEGR